MNVFIDNCRYAPSWVVLETLLQDTTNTPEGKITRINRPDRKCCYRDPGVYEVDFKHGDIVTPIKLTCQGIGEQQNTLESLERVIDIANRPNNDIEDGESVKNCKQLLELLKSGDLMITPKMK